MAISVPPLYLDPTIHVEVFATIAVAGSISSLAFMLLSSTESTRAKQISQILLAMWILGPPLWFFYEHFFFFPAHGNPALALSDLKAAQDVTSKVWAAIAVVLGATYSKKFSGGAQQN